MDGSPHTATASTIRGATHWTPSVHGSHLERVEERESDSAGRRRGVTGSSTLQRERHARAGRPIGTWATSASSRSRARPATSFESVDHPEVPHRASSPKLHERCPFDVAPSATLHAPTNARRDENRRAASTHMALRCHHNVSYGEPVHAVVNAPTQVATNGPRSEHPPPFPRHDAAARAPLALECICVTCCGSWPWGSGSTSRRRVRAVVCDVARRATAIACTTRR